MNVKVDIRRLEEAVREHEANGIEKNKIVFYGDSSFTRWQNRYDDNVNLEDVILGKDGVKAVINHGIGGGTSEELLYYYPRLVRAWEPRALVVQCYANDFASAYTPAEIMEIQSRIFEYAKKDFPGISIFVCDVRPLEKHVNNTSWKNHAKVFNELLYDYCQKNRDITLLSHAQNSIFFLSEEETGDYSKARTDLFIDDMLHYNHKGYDLYKGFFTEALKELL